MRTEGNLTFTANVAMALYLRVKIKSGSTTSPIEVELAGAGEGAIGTVIRSQPTAGKLVTIQPMNDAGSREMVAAGAISAAAVFYGAADGKISATVNGAAIGRSKEASTADGDEIEVIPYQSEGRSEGIQGGTIATTGDTDEYIIVPKTGKLTGIDFSPLVALAANDTNYITFTVTNLGQAGSGSTAMLAATDPNTTKATGGSALAINTKRSLTLHGTAANLDVTVGDRLRLRAGTSGTLANTVTKPVYQLQFAE